MTLCALRVASTSRTWRGTVSYVIILPVSPVRSAFAALLLLAFCACARPLQPEDDSDAAIRARIETIVRGRADMDLSHVTIDVYSRVVTITGIVPATDQLKQLKRLIDRVPGVEQIIDNVVVGD